MDFDSIRQAVELTGTSVSAMKSIGSIVDSVRQWIKGKGDEVPEEVQNLLMDLVSRVADAKLANAELTVKLADLQQQLVKEEAAKNLRARYQLARTEAGSYLLELKEEHWTEEPKHYACPDCFETGRRVVLSDGDHSSTICQVCKAFFAFRPSSPLDFTPRNVF